MKKVISIIVMLMVSMMVGVCMADSIMIVPSVSVPSTPMYSTHPMTVSAPSTNPVLGNTVSPVSSSYRTSEAVVARCSVTINPADGVIRGPNPITITFRDESTGPVVSRKWYRYTNLQPNHVYFDSRQSFISNTAHVATHYYYVVVQDASGKQYTSNVVSFVISSEVKPKPTPAPAPIADYVIDQQGAAYALIRDTSVHATFVIIRVLRSEDNRYVEKTASGRPGTRLHTGTLRRGSYDIKIEARSDLSRSKDVKLVKNAIIVR